MSETLIQLIHVKNQDEVLAQLREIFFESSTKKEFKDQSEREHFFEKYVGVYLKRWPEHCWVALDGKVLGYILGAPVTDLFDLQPHLEAFRSSFKDFPAHLHINCHADARGRGIGSKLLQKFEAQLKSQGVKGLHLLTGPASQNVGFYHKNGFAHSRVEGKILLLAKTLNA